MVPIVRFEQLLNIAFGKLLIKLLVVVAVATVVSGTFSSIPQRADRRSTSGTSSSSK